MPELRLVQVFNLKDARLSAMDKQTITWSFERLFEVAERGELIARIDFHSADKPYVAQLRRHVSYQ